MMKKSLAAFVLASCAVLSAAEPQRLAPSMPEDFIGSGVKKAEDGTLLLDAKGIIRSRENLKLDPAKSYQLSFDYKLAPESRPVQLITAVDAISPSGRRIFGFQVCGAPGSETELTAEAKPGDRILKVKDTSKWPNAIPPRVATFLAFNAKADGSDLPSTDMSSFIEKYTPEGEITLKTPLAKGYPAGTPVRIHLDRASFGTGTRYLRPMQEWRTLKVVIMPPAPDGTFSADRWWPGTDRIGILLQPSTEIPPGSGVLVRNPVREEH